MNIVLSVYSRNAYKEFVLPAVVNTRTTLVVRRDVFGLAENLNLNLENEDGIWFFAQDNNPGLVDPQNRERHELRDGDHFLYQSNGQTLVYLVVEYTAHRFESFQRYRLTNNQIEIGINPGCALQYSF